MKRRYRIGLMLLSWLALASIIYWSLDLLDLFWNLLDWAPALDVESLAMIILIAGSLVGLWFLSRARTNAVVSAVSLGICLLLLALIPRQMPRRVTSNAWYWGAELTQVAPRTPVPVWYQTAVVILMMAPTALWVSGMMHQRKQPERPPLSPG